jgi:HPt (histidine-containing phosphotransfer) domain-containing protein
VVSKTEEQGVVEMIDYGTFNKLKDRMQTKFPILLEGYLNDSRKYLSTVETNLPDGDLSAVIEATHSMKSASGLLGILQVHEAAETLEYAGKDMSQQGAANTDILRSYYDTLRSAFTNVEDVLEDELNKVKQA